jgi:predicted transcriptional regulator
MSKSTTNKTQPLVPLSEGEMALLNLLWELGPSSLATVHKNYSRPIGYTTIQTRLNRMVDKGVLSRSTEGYPAQYAAVVKIEVASTSFIEKAAKASGGCLAPLLAHLTEKRKLTPNEIALLKELIAKHE